MLMVCMDYQFDSTFKLMVEQNNMLNLVFEEHQSMRQEIVCYHQAMKGIVGMLVNHNLVREPSKRMDIGVETEDRKLEGEGEGNKDNWDPGL